MKSPIFDDSHSEQDTLIDLTPMLDVVFIMLIFFIVTASFVRETGVDIERPEATTAEQKENKNLLIAITPTNEIWIDNRRIDIRSVRANVARFHAENPSASVVIQADKNAKVDTLAKVTDYARAAGVYQVSLSTTSSTTAAY